MSNLKDTEVSNHLPYATVMFNHKLCRLQKRDVRPVGSGSDIQHVHVLITTVLDHIATYHQFENWRQPNTTQFGL